MRRKDLPTILEPAPPPSFAAPRRLYLLPGAWVFSQIMQDLGMALNIMENAFLSRNFPDGNNHFLRFF